MSELNFTPQAENGKQPQPNNRIARMKAALEAQAAKLTPDPIIERLRRMVEVLDQIASDLEARHGRQ